MDNDEQVTGLGKRLFFWWADRPAAHVLVLVAMTTLAIIGYVKPALVRDWFIAVETEEPLQEARLPAAVQNPARNEQLPDVEPFQVAGGECIVVATSEDFFTRQSLTAIRNVVADLESLPQVSGVLWLDSIPGLNLFGLPESLLPRSNASPRQMQLGRERTLDNPLAVGQLISTDGKTLLLHLRMDWFYVTTDEACTTDLRKAAEAATARVPGADLQFKVTGPAPLHLMMAHNHLHDSWRYQAVGYSIMLVTALVLFRGFSAVTIVAIAPALGVFWTMGMLHFFDFQDNPFNDIIVPVLISLVGLTDAVHL
ncbi:MAG TPA: MMPL family transporter, partial [Pirellulaceae bacterium]|nr:MMPL family transporter [Pirellulaceae bacterium]